MKPNISEFSYGYAITEELAGGAHGKVIAAPLFPSLYQEGKIGGWDVKLAFPSAVLFLQFKLSDRLTRSSAAECAAGMTPDFFRMHLRRRDKSNQHHLLVELANAEQLVFYAAPAFSEQHELNAHYLSKAVVENSFFVHPHAVGELQDDLEHTVAFEPPSTFCLRSTPKMISTGVFSGTKFVDLLADAARSAAAQHGPVELSSLAETMQAIAGSPAGSAERAPLASVAWQARLNFGCEAYVVFPIEEGQGQTPPKVDQ